MEQIKNGINVNISQEWCFIKCGKVKLEWEDFEYNLGLSRGEEQVVL